MIIRFLTIRFSLQQIIKLNQNSTENVANQQIIQCSSCHRRNRKVRKSETSESLKSFTLARFQISFGATTFDVESLVDDDEEF